MKTGITYLAPDFLETIQKIDNEVGIYLKDLKRDDVVELTTARHVYNLLVKDPTASAVIMTSNNPEFPGPMDTFVMGSRLSEFGRAVKSGWMVAGCRLELGGDLVLGTIQQIKVNGREFFPMKKNQLN